MSADWLLSLPDVPVTLHCCLSHLLCGKCSGHLAHSHVEPSGPLPGWLASPNPAATGGQLPAFLAREQSPRHYSRLLPALVSPPHTPLPGNFKLQVGSWATERQHTRTRTHTLQIAPTGYGFQLLPYLT